MLDDVPRATPAHTRSLFVIDGMPYDRAAATRDRQPVSALLQARNAALGE